MTSSAPIARNVFLAVAAGSLSFALPIQALQSTSIPPLPAVNALQRSAMVSGSDFVPTSALPYVITPERRAILNTIRFAEGTWKDGLDLGYRVMFGGGLMPHMKRHPNRVIYSSRYASAAAGAYQFMPFTWNLVQKKLGFRGFGPEAQDQGALFLIQRRKALALTDQGLMTPLLAAKLAPEWASFPTLQGRSYYGQPVKRFTRLNSFYNVALAQLRQERDQRRLDLSGDGARSTKPICRPPTILCSIR